MFDEGPSSEDIQSLDKDTGYCSECGAEIWDQSDICPKCGFALVRGTLSRPPVEDWWRRRWIALMGLLTAAAFLWTLLRYVF